MISIQELHEQNHQIAELAKTLSYLFQDREICDTSIVSELFARYCEKFDAHMSHNAEIYPCLLHNKDNSVCKTAERFLDGEHEVKRLFKSYVHTWFKKDLRIGDHDKFKKETSEIFDLVWGRIQAENEQLYPLFREHRPAS